jgi:Tfp pilus assembly protein PilX
MTSRRPKHSRGFAMLMALAMLGLVAMLLVFLAHYFAWEQKRTRTVSADAQLSQLLLAGAEDALAKTKSSDLPKDPWNLELPKPLADEKATVALTPHLESPDTADIVIDAQLDAQKASQTLHLRKSSSGWTLNSAVLSGAE